MKIKEMIKKYDITMVEKDGQEMLRAGRPPKSAAQIEKMKAAKAEIITELKRQKAEKEATEAKEKAEKEEEIRAISAGEKEIELHWHEGEVLSGWTVFGEAARLLEKIGLAKCVGGWGYHVALDTADALGERFTYPQAVEYTRPAREVKEAATQKDIKEKEAKFQKARETGEPVLLHRWTEECNDRDEECNLDIVYEYAMPDGSTSVERHHTW